MYLGRRLESNEVYVSIANGRVVKARDFREVPDSMACDPELFKRLVGTSYDYTGTLPTQMPGDDEELPKIPELQPVDGQEHAVRGLQFKERHFKNIGFSVGCLKCRMMQRGERSTNGHTPECRRRALKALRELEEFRHEVEMADNRMNEAIAREVERTIHMDEPVQAPSSSQHDCRNPAEGELNSGRPLRLEWNRCQMTTEQVSRDVPGR